MLKERWVSSWRTTPKGLGAFSVWANGSLSLSLSLSLALGLVLVLSEVGGLKTFKKVKNSLVF